MNIYIWENWKSINTSSLTHTYTSVSVYLLVYFSCWISITDGTFLLTHLYIHYFFFLPLSALIKVTLLLLRPSHFITFYWLFLSIRSFVRSLVGQSSSLLHLRRLFPSRKPIRIIVLPQQPANLLSKKSNKLSDQISSYFEWTRPSAFSFFFIFNHQIKTTSSIYLHSTR